MVELPESSRMRNWFGQAIVTPENAELSATEELYYGVPKIRGADGAGYIKVRQIVLSDVLRQYDDVNMVDMDIQGAEADAIDGWICLRDYPCGQINETEFGPISFVDGVQSWINQKLM